MLPVNANVVIVAGESALGAFGSPEQPIERIAKTNKGVFISANMEGLVLLATPGAIPGLGDVRGPARGVDEAATSREATIGIARPSQPAVAAMAVTLARVGTLAMFDSAMKVLAGTRGLIIDDRIRDAASTPLELFQFIRVPAPWIRRVESIATMHEAEGPLTGFVSQQAWTVPFPDDGVRPTRSLSS